MKQILSILFAALLFASCDPDKNKEVGDARVTLRFETRVGTEPFAIGDVYIDNLGYRYRAETFMSYLSMIELVRANGEVVLVKDFYVANFNTTPQLSVNVKEGDYTKVRFNLGVPEAYNKNVDPTTYPNSHPLSVLGSQGLFWQWNTGYIFTKFDGKADLEGVEGNLLLSPFAFHCGDDPLFRTVELDLGNSFIAGDSQKTLTVVLQVNKLLHGDEDQIDLEIDYLTHTSGNFLLARRFTDNFSKAFSLEE